MREEPSKTYGFVTDRDRHFEMPTMMRLLHSPAIIERAAQLLGPDLLCWRSQFFLQAPARATPCSGTRPRRTWSRTPWSPRCCRRAGTNSSSSPSGWPSIRRTRPTAACASCPASADAIRSITFGGDEGFYHSKYSMDYDFDNAEVDYIEAKPGEVIIF